jgi:multidrug efflux pump subunit AcrA (membrane-fusion protein)
VNKRNVNRLLLAVMFSIVSLNCGNSFAVTNADTQKVPVKVFTVVRRDISSNLSAMGTINYSAKADVSSEISGILSSVNVEEGEVVQRGQIIALIDTTLLQAQLMQVQATLEIAEIELLKLENEIRKAEFKIKSSTVFMEKLGDNFQTQKELFKVGGITQSELNEAEMNYQRSLAEYKTALEDLSLLNVKSNQGRIEAEAKVLKARADVEEIQAKIEKSIIRAPISGIISNKNKWTGEGIDPGDTVIVTIIKTDKVYAEADLNEKNMGLVKVGQHAKVVADAYPDISFIGKIHMISSTVDTDSRTVKAKVKVINGRFLLKPGMFVRVNITLDSVKNVIAVPQDAIINTKDGRKMVFVIVDEVAFLRKVQTGSQREGWVIVKEGLKVNEKVVVEGQERLRDLASVTSMEISGE